MNKTTIFLVTTLITLQSELTFITIVDDPKALGRRGAVTYSPETEPFCYCNFLGWMNEFITNEGGNCADISALLTSLV